MKLLRLLPLFALASASQLALGGEGWLTSWDQAVKLSKKTGRPILADFTGSDWCGWCIRLQGEVFDKPAFKTWAKNRVILLDLDYPRQKKQPAALKKQNVALAKRYRIGGFPTILFLNSAGKVLGTSGYEAGGPAAWLKSADGILAKKPR